MFLPDKVLVADLIEFSALFLSMLLLQLLLLLLSVAYRLLPVRSLSLRITKNLKSFLNALNSLEVPQNHKSYRRRHSPTLYFPD